MDFSESLPWNNRILVFAAQKPEVRPGGRYWEVPLNAYPRMEQGGAILSFAANVEPARQFRDFLLSEEGRSVLRDYGFFLPGE